MAFTLATHLCGGRCSLSGVMQRTGKARGQRGSGLGSKGEIRLVVWALSDNESAVEFYRALGGRPVVRSCEKFGENTLDLVAYAWQA
jgi:hypothetical protein